MNPISLMHLQTLLLPSPRSHWSATGPMSKTQPINTRNTQRKITRALAARVKPVRPVLQTGHTGFAQKTPEEQQDQKPSKRTPNTTKLGQGNFLGKEQHACQKSSGTATVTRTGQTCFPNRSDQFRPDRQEKQPAGQTPTSSRPISRITPRIAAKLWD
jgi:hypothetical protein